jgi:hypothetical protein
MDDNIGFSELVDFTKKSLLTEKLPFSAITILLKFKTRQLEENTLTWFFKQPKESIAERIDEGSNFENITNEFYEYFSKRFSKLETIKIVIYISNNLFSQFIMSNMKYKDYFITENNFSMKMNIEGITCYLFVIGILL